MREYWPSLVETITMKFAKPRLLFDSVWLLHNTSHQILVGGNAGTRQWNDDCFFTILNSDQLQFVQVELRHSLPPIFDDFDCDTSLNQKKLVCQ